MSTAKKARWNPVKDIDAPNHWRDQRDATLAIDLFDWSHGRDFIDHVFAVMASGGRHSFTLFTAQQSRVNAYLASVVKRGEKAGLLYERRMRAHFRRYKYEFREGYSLPEPPTPELRVLYDSAAKRESRPVSPDGTTLSYGFSHGEFHWRKWPLNNVRIVEEHAA